MARNRNTQSSDPASTPPAPDPADLTEDCQDPLPDSPLDSTEAPASDDPTPADTEAGQDPLPEGTTAMVRLDSLEQPVPLSGLVCMADGTLLGNAASRVLTLEHPGEQLHYPQEQLRTLILWLALHCADPRREVLQDPQSPLRGLNMWPTLLQQAFNLRQSADGVGLKRRAFNL
ncbi:MAG TPA: hypothetical protein PKM73_14475 [Verrucomicrobiota bacterium]|nr:hypothetical protein [Verrucomicrobiota bacterium]